MSPSAIITREKKQTTDSRHHFYQSERFTRYMDEKWINETNIEDSNDLNYHTRNKEDKANSTPMLDRLRLETRSLGVQRGFNDRLPVATVLDAIENEDEEEDLIEQVDPLVNGFHHFITKNVDRSVHKEVVIEGLIDVCRDIAGAPEEVFKEIEQSSQEEGLGVVIELLEGHIPEMISKKKKVIKLKRKIAKKAIKKAITEEQEAIAA